MKRYAERHEPTGSPPRRLTLKREKLRLLSKIDLSLVVGGTGTQITREHDNMTSCQREPEP